MNIWDLLSGANQAQAAPKPMAAPTPVPMYLAADYPAQLGMAEFLGGQKNLVDEQQAPQAPMPVPSVNQQMPQVSPGNIQRAQMPVQKQEMDPLDLEMKRLYQNQMNSRMSAVQGKEAELAKLGEKPKGIEHLDLSPLYALSDAWNGTNSASHYKAPTGQKDWEGKKQMLQAALDKERGGLSDDQLNYLKMRLQEKNNKAMMEMGRQGRFEDSQSLKMEDNIRKDVSKISDLYKADQMGLDTIDDALASGNLNAVKATLSKFARTIGGEKGALSDGDVARVMPNTGVNTLANLENWITSKGVMDPEVQRVMQQLSASARQNAERYQIERMNARRKAYESGSYKPLMQKGRVGDVIFNEIGGQNPTQQQAPQSSQSTNAPPKASGLSAEDEWVAQRRGKK